MPRKPPQPINIHVGSRLRIRRTLLDISQQQIAQKLGIGYQSVAKYESGENGISLNRLHTIGQMLDVGLAYFFEDMPPIQGHAPLLADPDANTLAKNELALISTRDSMDLLKSFYQIADKDLRRNFLSHFMLIAKMQTGDSQG